MRWLPVAAGALLVLCGPASAHRLDEYLEATLLSIEPDRVDGSMRLVPGVGVAAGVIAGIDSDGDDVISDAEQRAYAANVLKDLLLSIDGVPLHIQPEQVHFPSIDEMRQGIGEIQIDFTAKLAPARTGRQLMFENRHRRDIAVYLVNCLVPHDRGIQIAKQARNENQSSYRVDFVQGSAEVRSAPSLDGFRGAFRMGARHIAAGTDHLLFLLALLLPSPLLPWRGRWSQGVPVTRTLGRVTAIVTAFTLGHSLTLALSVFGIVRLPARPVEVLIAVSILASAIHAIRPVFPGREPVVAACFGLIHGLAFASALDELGFGPQYKVITLFGFNLGIEFMQLVAVGAVIPSLLLLSRTTAYPVFRIAGAGFAAVSAAAWIADRAFGLSNGVEPLVEAAAHRAPAIGVGLFLFAASCRLLQAIGSSHRLTGSSVDVA
jgi:hypothetical protein